MFCVTITSCVPPACSAAAIAPSFDDWLNDLSSSCPTSVTTPTLIGLRFDVDAGGCDAPVDGSVDAPVDGAADEAAGAGEPPPPQAETRMARPLNRVRPIELLRMCPPP